jgi:6-phosphogluconolactonase
MRIVTDNPQALEAEATRFIQTRLNSAVRTSGTAILGLPGGRSVTGILDGLARSAVDWTGVHIFLADERRVPIDSPDSNFRELNDHLFRPLQTAGTLKRSTVHPATTGAADYSKEFRSVGERFDLLVLGAGEDGHIASLFPGHSGLTSTDEFFIDVDDSPKPPPRRISASVSQVQRSGAIVLLFFGKGKRDALQQFLDPSVSAAVCPARMTVFCKDLLVLTDQPLD